MKSCKFILYGFIIQKKISCRQLSENHHILNLHPLGPPELLPQGRGEDHHFAKGLHLQRSGWNAKVNVLFLIPKVGTLKIVKTWWKTTVELNFQCYISMLQGLRHNLLNSKYLHSRDWKKNVTIHPRSTSSSTSALTSAFSSWTHITFMRVGRAPAFDPLYSGRKPYLPNRSTSTTQVRSWSWWKWARKNVTSLEWSEVNDVSLCIFLSSPTSSASWSPQLFHSPAETSLCNNVLQKYKAQLTPKKKTFWHILTIFPITKELLFFPATKRPRPTSRTDLWSLQGADADGSIRSESEISAQWVQDSPTWNVKSFFGGIFSCLFVKD